MPYKLFKQDGKYCVRNKDTGENKGCSKTRSMAVEHMRALYAAEGGAKMGKKEAESLSDEVIDALVLSSVKEFEQEYPDDPENQNKEMDYQDGVWLRPGITSYAELDAVITEEERVDEMRDLVKAYPTLANNILWNPDIIDKPAALKQLADELGERLNNVNNKEKNIFERITSAVKERLFPKEEPNSDKDQGFMIWKEGNQWRWVARYSNNFRDRDNPPEIISAASHRNFVEMVDKGLAPYPELWLWHVPEWKIGQATMVAYDESGFAMAGGYFDKGREQVAEWLSKQKDIAVSHGMPPKSIVRDENDQSVIVKHQTAEVSPLPSWAAANVLTDFMIMTKEAIMAIPENKRKFLIENWGMPEDVVAKLEATNEQTAASAKELGLESKESEQVEQSEETTAEATSAAESATEEAPAEEKSEEKQTDIAPEVKEKQEDPQNEYPTRKEVADAVVNIIVPVIDKQNEVIASLTKQVADLSQTVASLRKSDEEKMTELVKETPMASLSALLTGVIGNQAAEVDGRESLAKQKPKETEHVNADAQPTPVPFLNSMITSAGK